MKYREPMEKIDKILKNFERSEKTLEKIVKILYQEIDHYNWIGIYIVKNQYLILGPWEGKQATEHTTIPIGQGVCGSAAATGNTEIIADVKKDNRYLACFINTKSEIVVPIRKNGKIVAEIDVDSDKKDAFTQQDKVFLEKISKKIKDFF